MCLIILYTLFHLIIISDKPNSIVTYPKRHISIYVNYIDPIAKRNKTLWCDLIPLSGPFHLLSISLAQTSFCLTDLKEFKHFDAMCPCPKVRPRQDGKPSDATQNGTTPKKKIEKILKDLLLFPERHDLNSCKKPVTAFV